MKIKSAQTDLYNSNIYSVKILTESLINSMLQQRAITAVKGDVKLLKRLSEFIHF